MYSIVHQKPRTGKSLHTRGRRHNGSVAFMYLVYTVLYNRSRDWGAQLALYNMRLKLFLDECSYIYICTVYNIWLL